MSSDNTVLVFEECPRCGWSTLERLPSNSYCVNCNYSDAEEEREKIPYHVVLLLKEREREKKELLANRREAAIAAFDKNVIQNKQEVFCA